MAKRKLIDPEVLKTENPPDKPIPVLLRTDSEIMHWLHKIFEMKISDQIEISFSAIAEELSLFLERDVKGRQVNNEYLEWQRKRKRN